MLVPPRAIATVGLVALVSAASPACGDSTRQLPGGITIPDGYFIEWSRNPPRYTAPANADTVVSFDVVRPAPGRPRMSFTYDQESRMIGDGADIVRFEFEIRF